MPPIWSEVGAIVQRGGRPVIFVDRARAIIEHRSRGRPRVRPFGVKKGFGYSRTTSTGSPMRCRRRGCQRVLAKNAANIVCSDACAALLRLECEEFLDILDGRVAARDLSPYYRAFNPAFPRRRV